MAKYFIEETRGLALLALYTELYGGENRDGGYDTAGAIWKNRITIGARIRQERRDRWQERLQSGNRILKILL